ncbi:hypothetical protein ACJ7V3_06930 [Halomonas elongata]|uniref:DUF4376 domain-containing protein n=1 Tax=Halomonas elongata TaxID=2746 RepID=UPI0038D4372E
MMDYRNAQYLNDGGIDCEINHPELGWIPTTLREDDPDTAELHAIAKAQAAPPQPEPLENVARDRRRTIDIERDRTIQAGMPYTFPDGSEDVVQMRDRDRPNLTGLALEAQRLVAKGETEPALEFRAASNRHYVMTPAQMLEMTDTAQGWHKAMLKRAWDLKDQIDAAIAASDREALQAIAWT